MLGVVLLAVSVILLVILLLRIHLFIVYEDDVSVYAKVLFFKYGLYPQSKKNLKIKEFTAKGITKKLKRDKARLDKQIVKEKKKSERAEDRSKVNVADTLKLVTDILLAIRKRFFKYLHVDVANLNLIVATDDAAKTAIEYGIAVQGVQYIVTILDSITNFKVKRRGRIYVGCDFCSERTEFDLSLSLSLRVWQIIVILIKAGIAFVLNSGKKAKKDN